MDEIEAEKRVEKIYERADSEKKNSQWAFSHTHEERAQINKIRN